MSVGVLQGRTWVFGDNMDTDQMAPMAAMAVTPEKRKLLLFPTKPEFGPSVAEGDIIIAGQNWGCGSSRENAPGNLKEIGVAAVVAESFSRIFFRNSVAIGLVALECPGISAAVNEGDRVEIDVENARVLNVRTGATLQARLYTSLMLEIVERGGILELLADRVQSSNPRTAGAARPEKGA